MSSKPEPGSTMILIDLITSESHSLLPPLIPHHTSMSEAPYHLDMYSRHFKQKVKQSRKVRSSAHPSSMHPSSTKNRHSGMVSQQVPRQRNLRHEERGGAKQPNRSRSRVATAPESKVPPSPYRRIERIENATLSRHAHTLPRSSRQRQGRVASQLHHPLSTTCQPLLTPQQPQRPPLRHRL